MLTIADIRHKITPVCRRYGIKKAFLFGSYSRGEAKESSDVDLRVERGEIDDLFTMISFRMDLKDALGKEVDLISVQPDSIDFCNNLSRDEVLLYDDCTTGHSRSYGTVY